MVSSSIKSLDLKTISSPKSKVSSKEDDSSFQNEMIENEKKMKKKTKVDGRENTQTHATAPQSVPKPKEQKSAKSEGQPAASGKVNTAGRDNEIASNKKMTVNQVAPQGVVPTVETEEALLHLGEIVQNNLSEGINPEAKALKSLSLKEGLDLSGFQMVQPQMVTTVEGKESNETTALPQLEKILSELKTEITKDKSDLLQQGFEQSAAPDVANVLNGMPAHQVKEMAANFAQVLEAKSLPQENISANIDNIISSASTIIKDGGGEMKMQLNPEGLGTIDLKVGVDKGQVSVEIITQDQNVKKMFEDNIFDIRAALETKNLKVDTFHVGVSEHFDQNFGQQMAQQQFNEREFARNFMGQFRDERQALRSPSIDNILHNPNSMGPQREGLSAASTKNLNGRLNLIA